MWKTLLRFCQQLKWVHVSGDIWQVSLFLKIAISCTWLCCLRRWISAKEWMVNGLVECWLCHYASFSWNLYEVHYWYWYFLLFWQCVDHHLSLNNMICQHLLITFGLIILSPSPNYRLQCIPLVLTLPSSAAHNLGMVRFGSVRFFNGF